MAFNQFEVSSQLQKVQSQLMSASIRDASNVALLRSEEAIRNVIASYAEKFNSTGGMLTQIAKHQVDAGDLITTQQFNDLFNSLYIDLTALYKEIQYVDEILNINLDRNVKFFGLLKKRMRDLWHKLELTRLSISDDSPSDESYFESFSSLGSKHTYSNLLLDKKTGVLYLSPRVREIQNESYQIKNITARTFPVHTPDGGVIFTTDVLNTFEYNYDAGNPRDMLINGLWKEQVFCKDVPEILYNVTEQDDNLLKVRAIGILSLIDIEYTYPVDINAIDIDVFGEYPVSILGILYRNTNTESWKRAKKYVYDSDSNLYIDGFRGVEKFDIISIKNIETFNAKYVRLILNQKYYDVLDSTDLNVFTQEEKINQDLAERRLEIVKLESDSDDDAKKPKEYSNESMYVQIMDIVENTKSIGETLLKIVNVINPPVKVEQVDFGRTLKYELGAWEIAPSDYQFGSAIGKFDSGPYQLRDKSLILTTLSVAQEIPDGTTCNWYISNPDKPNLNIPILPQGVSLRKEPVHFVSLSDMESNGWTVGSFIQLDFPIDPSYISSIKIYRNGTAIPLSSFSYYFMNSSIIYINDIVDSTKDNYVIEYVPAIFDTVNIYALEQIKSDNFNLHLGVASTSINVLKAFVKNTYFGAPNDIGVIQDNYTVKRMNCTSAEYTLFFSNKYTNNLFISSRLLPLFSNVIARGVLRYSTGVCKNDAVYSTVFPTLFDSDLLGTSYIPMVPRKIERNIDV